jgi:hypothetical protein
MRGLTDEERSMVMAATATDGTATFSIERIHVAFGLVARGLLRWSGPTDFCEADLSACKYVLSLDAMARGLTVPV